MRKFYFTEILRKFRLASDLPFNIIEASNNERSDMQQSRIDIKIPTKWKDKLAEIAKQNHRGNMTEAIVSMIKNKRLKGGKK